MKTINVLYCVDDNFVIHTAVSMFSLSCNCDPGHNIRFFVLCDGLNSKNMDLLSEVVTLTGSDLFLVKPGKMNDLNVRFHTNRISMAAFYRIFAPGLLGVDKFVYLDGDTMVCDNIVNFYSSDLSGKIVGAVQDWWIPKLHSEYKLMQSPRNHLPGLFEFGLNADMPYFNAGVLLVGAKEWRENNIEEKALGYINKYGNYLRYVDQDVLNAVLAGKWKKMRGRWNLNPAVTGHRKGDRKSFYYSREDEICEGLKMPGIIHYVGNRKPWYYPGAAPMSEHYWAYRKQAGIKFSREVRSRLKGYWEYWNYISSPKLRKKFKDLWN